MPKQTLRRQLLRQRRQLQPEAVFSLGQRIQHRLLQEEAFTQAETLMLYSPIQNEVATDLILRAALRHDRTVVYPRVRGEALDLVRVGSPADLKPGAFGVLEPEGDRSHSVDQIDLILVPGVGFDRRGYRLGFGKGFYDRLLEGSGFNGVTIGLCYGFQLVKELPVEPHDMPVDCVITENDKLVFPPV